MKNLQNFLSISHKLLAARLCFKWNYIISNCQQCVYRLIYLCLSHLQLRSTKKKLSTYKRNKKKQSLTNIIRPIKHSFWCKSTQARLISARDFKNPLFILTTDSKNTLLWPPQGSSSDILCIQCCRMGLHSCVYFKCRAQHPNHKTK